MEQNKINNCLVHIMEAERLMRTGSIDLASIELCHVFDYLTACIRKKNQKLDRCYICDGVLSSFLLTPLIETANGLFQCCKECADKEFPGWEEDKSEEMEQD
jgi:hypothetical protein